MPITPFCEADGPSTNELVIVAMADASRSHICLEVFEQAADWCEGAAATIGAREFKDPRC